MLDYLSLTKREREQRIAAETIQLKATDPGLSLVTPEMEWEIERASRKLFKSLGTKPR